jgi:hypothetical protein
MEISRKAILDKTHYGLTIYSHVLQEYYPGETVLSLSGRACLPAKNPFNNDRLTLKIVNQNWIFRFEDTELEDFNGDPFDFAGKHYNLSGDELLGQLNNSMNLGLTIPEENAVKKWTQETCRAYRQPPEFSLFLHPVSNILPYQSINLVEAWNLIRSVFYKDQTQELRSITDPGKARKYKASQFDYTTFSGVFSKRNDQSMISHSGLLAIDFDHVPDVGELKLTLISDDYFETELMFVSPSGDGLKWIIPIDLGECPHQEWFQAISEYIKTTYHLEIDKSGKDISRACFLPYDPQAYINPGYLTNQIHH